ncbi:MAG TPA: biosynthetic-type acetolactate synthase large subunit [Nitrososphaerales archaeon]|nr:biosynthetic-type acetolactate synthase large subunit [Nitrososphaerales archaeon]
MTQKMSGARATVEALEREKVEYIFGMPGGANLPFYDALWDSKIKHVLVRHEQLGAHMADAYGRVSRKAGVCSATSGPGATNLITGIATAFADSSPVVAITGQVPKGMTGRNAFQETDVIGIATPVTKYTLQPLSAAEVPFAVKTAFYIATTGRPGPVLLDLPKDVQQEEAEMTFPESVSVRAYRPSVPVDAQDVERAAAMIVKAERPILWGGGGVRIADAAQPFAAIAELLMAPVITTLQGKGDFPEDHPLSLGPIGMHGRAEANKLVSECDLLVAVGVRFSDRSTGNFAEFAPTAKIIHIDADPTEFNKNKAVDLSILGDANQVLAMLFDAIARRLAKSKDPNSNPWLKRVNAVREELKGIPAYKDSYAELSGPKIVKKMRDILPPEAILTTGVGRHQMWCEIHYKVLRPRTWITSTGLGTMGFGLPAAIGAKYAKPDVPVVDFDGDGSFVMTEQALATAVEERLPIIAVIINDRSLGMVEQWQRLMYNRRYRGIKFPNVPDFVKLTEAYGAHGKTVGSLDEFGKAMREGLANEGPTVIEVPVSPEEDVYPFLPPGKSIKETVYGSSKEMAVF